MVLVPVSQNNSDDVVETVSNVTKIRQDHVDARLVFLREEHANVDDQQLAVDFEYGHVATYLADSA